MYLSVLGMTGLTAYVGLLEIGRDPPGEAGGATSAPHNRFMAKSLVFFPAMTMTWMPAALKVRKRSHDDAPSGGSRRCSSSNCS